MVARSLITLGLCLSLTAEAHAQAAADDMAYCAQLSALYRRYLGNTGEGRRSEEHTSELQSHA